MSSKSHGATRVRAIYAALPKAPALAVVLCLALSTFVASVRADQESCVAAHEQGQELRIQGHLQAARERFAQCAQSCPKLISQDCKSMLEEVEQSAPSVVFAVSDEQGADLAGARVFANDKLLSEQSDGRALPLDPGSYRIRVEAEGYAPLERKVTLYAGEKQRVLRLELSRPRAMEPSASAATNEGNARAKSSSSVPIATFALGGAALAVGGAAVALGVLGKGELDDLKQRCPPEGCSREETKKGRSLYIAADVGFAVAGGLAVAATWVYVAKLLGEKGSAERASRLTPWLDAQRAGVALDARF